LGEKHKGWKQEVERVYRQKKTTRKNYHENQKKKNTEE